ncbi:MAG: hypothetical protein KA731_01960 [Candidatus Moranbacteria bacterium]|nr:hypothetical protein [Candidatus Moranbacteria bacterium]MBP7696030.1 hypothetical protein [Candidatus Moranbacteria bacterium]
MSRTMTPEKKRRLRIRKLARAHGLLTVLIFSVYFAAGFFLHPSFLVSDVREKVSAIADTLTVFARVLAPPVKPIVTAESVCVSGGPAIVLDWADDENSLSYDIARDSLPLSTGVVVSGYADTTVALGQTATYVVTALGPMGPGFNDSDPVSVTALTGCDSDILPTIEIQTAMGRNIVGETERQHTTDRNPRFTGVTNLPGARIDILATSYRETIEATVFANSNGYFAWSYAGRLDFDPYDVTFTATDIADSALTISQTVKISIEKEELDASGKPKTSTTVPQTPEKPIETRSAIDIGLSVSGTEFHSGDWLGATLSITSISADLVGDQAVVSFMIVDGDGKVIDRDTESVVLRSGFDIEQRFRIPYGMTGKEYRLVAEISTEGHRSVREAAFRVLELPLFKLGGETVTYEQAVSQVGWISFVSLFLFFWWLLLFLREYYLYSQSERHIDGHDLHKAGYY